MGTSRLLLCTFFICIFLFNGCGLLGIHFQVHNPAKPGKIPAFSDEQILLGELTKYRTCFDVHFYDLDVTFFPNQKSISGKVQLHATATTNFDTLQVDLDDRLSIHSLTDLSGKSLPYIRRERAVFVRYPQTKGNAFKMYISYSGKPQKAKKPPWKGGVVWKKDKNKNVWGGVACESEGASIWWPLKDHTSDEPDSMMIHYTVPKGLMAIGNGQFVSKEEKDTQTTFNWKVTYPINTYNVTYYLGKFKELKQSYTGINGKELDITHYVLPYNYEKAKEHFEQVLPILKCYETIFGPYPWYNDGFTLVESPYAGMEHQTAIAYGAAYENDYGSETDYIILHETAHEWWGNAITVADLADVWLQEGFATYSEVLYFERYDESMSADIHLSFHRIFIKNKYPVVSVKDRRWFHFRKNSDVYMKGAWILHTLRTQLDNDSLFFDILSSFYMTKRYQITNSEEFIAHVNQKTGNDYHWFFDQYLYRNESPELEFQFMNDGTIWYRWSNVKPEFDKLEVHLKVGKDTVTIVPSIEIKSIELPVDENGYYSFNFIEDKLYAVNKVRRFKLELVK